jgi:hypothetical protein
MFADIALWLLASILYFGVVTWAGMLWLSIFLLERDNPYNKFHHALIYSAIRIGIDIAVSIISFGYLGLGLLGAYLVLGVKLLTYHYELALWKAIAVIGLMVAMPYLLMGEIADFVGDSWFRLGLVFYGLPTAILAAWLVGRWRGRYARKPSTLPEARILTARAPTANVANEVPAAAKPVEKGPAAPPVRMSQPLIPLRSSAPEIEVQAAPSDGPKFLR